MGRESEVNGNVVGSVVKGSVIGEGVWALAAQPVDRRGGVSVQWGCAAGTSAKWRGTVPLCCWCVIGFIFRYLNHRLRIQHARRASTRQIRRRSRLRQSQRRRHRDACCCGLITAIASLAWAAAIACVQAL